jgi:hypothetical protein
LPTAVQELADTHETPPSELLLVLAFGLVTTDQALPFHDSTSVTSSLLELK